jgi:hypothetical protein
MQINGNGNTVTTNATPPSGQPLWMSWAMLIATIGGVVIQWF